MAPPGIRVLIIDDHRLFAEVIHSTLERMGLEVLDVVGTGGEGIDAVRRHRPDLVLVDIGLPDESGLVVGKQILEEAPDTKVVVVSAFTGARVVSEAIRLGCHGYITKDAPVSQFISSIRAVLDGQVVVPKQLARQVAGARSPERRLAAMLIAQLTPREREVLAMLAEGRGSAEMARQLSVSPNTVRTHVQNILMKLQVHSRLEAAAFAVRHGLVNLPQVYGDPRGPRSR